MLDDGPAKETAHMRTLQEIARGGATFTRAYTPTPICVPSRATIQTGLYRKRHGVFSNGYQGLVQTGNINRTFAVGLRTRGSRPRSSGSTSTGRRRRFPDGAPSSRT
jgi:arylsulfatase A-like enzyme